MLTCWLVWLYEPSVDTRVQHSNMLLIIPRTAVILQNRCPRWMKKKNSFNIISIFFSSADLRMDTLNHGVKFEVRFSWSSWKNQWEKNLATRGNLLVGTMILKNLVIQSYSLEKTLRNRSISISADCSFLWYICSVSLIGSPSSVWHFLMQFVIFFQRCFYKWCLNWIVYCWCVFMKHVCALFLVTFVFCDWSSVLCQRWKKYPTCR